MPVQPWLRTTLKLLGWTVLFVMLCAAGLLSMLISPPRTYDSVGGKWYSAGEWEIIADSGRKPRYLVRGRLPFFRRDVADDITHIQYLGDDCIVYTFVKATGEESYAACGDHGPVFLDHLEDYWNVSLDSDPLRLHDKTISVAEVKRRASHE